MRVVALAASLAIFALVPPLLAADRYPLSSFDGYTNASVNISVYVFRDMNRNGIYDMGDRPMSGIIVDAHGGRKALSRRSNRSGFANFEMSASDIHKDITFAGRYEFSLAVPPGWSVTTGNAVQLANFELMPGSPADIVTPLPPSPVGLAPSLNISGRVLPSDEPFFDVTSPAGETVRVAVEAGGRFKFAASPGDWLVGSEDDATNASPRKVSVTNFPVVLSRQYDEPPALGGDLRTVTFDDLQSASVLKVPSGYGGLGWSNFVMAHEKVYVVSGYRNNVVSGEFVAYNGSGHPASIYAAAPFDFVGGYIGASNLLAEGETLTVTAWRNDKVAYEEVLTLSALGALYFAADFHQVTRIDFQTTHYWQATFDDLIFVVPN